MAGVMTLKVFNGFFAFQSSRGFGHKISKHSLSNAINLETKNLKCEETRL
jgi:hypothetical protein